MTATWTEPALPITNFPAWPIAVESGNDGISVKGIRVASVSESAKLPRPEPRTRPTFGRKLVRWSMNWAAVSASVNWLVIELAAPEDSELLLKPDEFAFQLPLGAGKF